VPERVYIETTFVSYLTALLTWNCRHLANATMRVQLETACASKGYKAPIICTPEEMTEAER